MITPKKQLFPLRDVTIESIRFRGHPMIRSTHPTTIEITTEDHLTEKGDCIIGVGAEKGCKQLDPRVKERLSRGETQVKIRIVVGKHSFQMNAWGDPRLDLTDLHDIVIRKSEFVSGRTLAVRADAAARDIPRSMIMMLRDPTEVGRLEIEVTR